MNVVVIDGTGGELISKIDSQLEDLKLINGIDFHFFGDVVEAMQNMIDLDPGLIICDYKLVSSTGGTYTGDDVFEYLETEIGMSYRGMIFTSTSTEECERRRNTKVPVYERGFLGLSGLVRIIGEAQRLWAMEFGAGKIR